MNTESQIKDGGIKSTIKSTKEAKFTRHSTQQCPNHPMCGLPKGHDLSKCCVIPPDNTDNPPKKEHSYSSNVNPFTVNFESYDMYEVIRKLCEKSKVASFFGTHCMSPPWALTDRDIEAQLIGPDKYIDYLKGRVFKTSFASFPLLNSFGYDRDNGVGAMQKVLDNMNINKNS